MLVLGLESSCDETGVALYSRERGLLAHSLHSQIALHAAYGGVVPELASRDHIRRILPLIDDCLAQASCPRESIDAIGYTAGPGLAGALLVASALAHGLGFALDRPVIPVHHLEGHLLSPLLAEPRPAFPFVALLVSGGHTQLMWVEAVGCYRLLGETVDDAAGEAFDKTAQLLGLGYPGGAALSRLAGQGSPNGAARFTLPRPMLHSGTLDFSFAGLKTAVRIRVQKQLREESCTGYSGRAAQTSGGASPSLAMRDPQGGLLAQQTRADIALAFQQAMVDLLLAKSLAALKACGSHRLVVAGGVGANRQLRSALDAWAAQAGGEVFYPPLHFCTDNGAMIALAAAHHPEQAQAAGSFAVHPRWVLGEGRHCAARSEAQGEG